MTNPAQHDSLDQPRLDDLISLQEASQLSGLTQQHLALLIRRGELWGKRIGHSWVTTYQAINQYQALEHKPGPKRKKQN
jgi:hypothetical protein